MSDRPEPAEAQTPGSDDGARAPQDPATSDAPGATEPALPLGGGVGRAVRAGLGGESLSRQGVLEAIGGWRGIAETLVPGLLFLVMFTITRDARISAIAPAALAIIAVAVRLIRREPVASAFSGAAGVAIAVAATLFTGRGEDYYLPGFWTNGLWSLGLLISLAVGWPLLGFVLGGLRGDLRAWRRDRSLRRVATWLTLLWLGMFLARLAVQLPLYFAGQADTPGAIEALGVARLVMGVPLFALVIVFTWMVLSRLRQSSDDSTAEIVDTTGDNAPRP